MRNSFYEVLTSAVTFSLINNSRECVGVLFAVITLFFIFMYFFVN